MNAAQRKELTPLIEALRAAASAIEDAKSQVESIRDAEQEKFDNMPEGLQGGERGDKMNTMIEHLTSIVDFDIDSLTSACDEVEGEL